MLSVLVCHSYFLRLDQKQLERAKPYPPLATLQVCAMLRRKGRQVAFFDAMIAQGLEDFERTLESVRPPVVLLYEDTFNFLSKMCLGTMRRAACQMIGSARRSGARVIVAGPDVSDAPAPYLLAGADVTLVGEGLSALLDLLGRLDVHPRAPAGELACGLSGVNVLRQHEVVTPIDETRAVAVHGPADHSGARVLRGADYEGSAAWDLVDMDRYRGVWTKAHGYFSLNMAASRGCSFRCAWCAKPTWGNLYLQRDAAAVAAEMAYLKRSFDPQHIWFADDIFGFRVDWVTDFAAAAAAAGGAVRFTIQTRADLISESMAQALERAGCFEAWIGAESGSQRVLDAMNKGTTVSQIKNARSRFRSAGIRVGFFIQLGYLGEELADILATRDLLLAARPDEIGVSVSYPLPGTKFHDRVKAQLGPKTRWQESSDLDMMFRGTYTSDFYRLIRNLLHQQISLQTSVAGFEQHEPTPETIELGARSLDRRWQELIDGEAQYRSPVARSAAAI
jgi:anaerobic magnesium-protoporphyrin IX monomethyl ester cyclase